MAPSPATWQTDMRLEDNIGFSFGALTSGRGRSWLMLLAMAIGVSSIMLLTALGEGARFYVNDKFAGLGTNLLIVLPGRSETTGGPPPLVGGTPRDLTLEDALSLKRTSTIRRSAPVALGSAPLSYGSLEREVTVVGSTAELEPIRNLETKRGRFLPVMDPRREAPVVVLGAKLKQILFGNEQALGKWVRIQDSRFQVIGVLDPAGESLGMDVGEMVIIPVSSALRLFNTNTLFRIMIQASGKESIPRAKQAVLDIIKARHDDEEDITIITQDALLATFDGIFQALTYTVAGIGAISLVVAGILIMNVMLISVSRRTAEIGLLIAVGGAQRTILQLFLIEAALLSLSGALAGVAIAYAAVWLAGYWYPGFPLIIPNWSLIAALVVSLGVGLLFGVLPARKAAKLDPVQALMG